MYKTVTYRTVKCGTYKTIRGYLVLAALERSREVGELEVHPQRQALHDQRWEHVPD